MTDTGCAVYSAGEPEVAQGEGYPPPDVPCWIIYLPPMPLPRKRYILYELSVRLVVFQQLDVGAVAPTHPLSLDQVDPANLLSVNVDE